MELQRFADEYTDDYFILRIKTANIVSDMIFCNRHGYNRDHLLQIN